MTRKRVRLISPDSLREAMNAQNATYRTLARWAGCSHAMIGYLATGAIETCTPALAARIEHALAKKPGSLFLPALSSVTLDNATLDKEESNERESA